MGEDVAVRRNPIGTAELRAQTESKRIEMNLVIARQWVRRGDSASMMSILRVDFSVNQSWSIREHSL